MGEIKNMSTSVLKGKIIVICIALFMVSISFYNTFISNTTAHPYVRTESFIRLFITCILCLSLYKGHTFARWITMVFVFAAALYGLYSGFYVLINKPDDGFSGLLLVVISLIYGAIGVLLAVSVSVKEFTEYQKISSEK